MGKLINEEDVMEILTDIELSATLTPIMEAKKRLRDIPVCHDLSNVIAELDRRINTQLKIIAGLNVPVHRYGFTKSLEAYQQCKLILEDLIN